MQYIISGAIFVVSFIFAFMLGFNYAIKEKSKQMMEKMNMGTITFDLRSGADEMMQVDFEKSPREMLDKSFVLMEIKIRQ